MIDRSIKRWLWIGGGLASVGIACFFVFFVREYFDLDSTQSYAVIAVGVAIIILGDAALWRGWLLGRRVARRLETRRCVECGYQLRGLSDNVCPECGRRQPHVRPALLEKRRWWR